MEDKDLLWSQRILLMNPNELRILAQKVIDEHNNKMLKQTTLEMGSIREGEKK